MRRAGVELMRERTAWPGCDFQLFRRLQQIRAAAELYLSCSESWRERGLCRDCGNQFLCLPAEFVPADIWDQLAAELRQDNKNGYDRCQRLRGGELAGTG